MRCRYPDQPLYPIGPYQLVVIDQAGHAQQAATWQVVPGKVSTITASVDLPRTKIAGLEVRSNTGRSVLRADR